MDIQKVTVKPSAGEKLSPEQIIAAAEGSRLYDQSEQLRAAYPSKASFIEGQLLASGSKAAVK